MVKRTRNDFALDNPMKKMLSLMHLNCLAKESDVMYSFIYRYLNGMNKNLKPEDYEKIKNTIQSLVNEI